MKRQQTIIALVIFIAVAAIAYFLFPKTKTAPTPANANAPINASASKNEIITATIPQITVSSPKKSGDEMTIDLIKTPVHSFVVINETSDGKIGKAVGVSNLVIFPETKEMKINATLVAGKTYIAILHGDDGNGVYSQKSDPPFIYKGKTVTATFKAN